MIKSILASPDGELAFFEAIKMICRLLLVVSVFLASCAASGNMFQKLEVPEPGQAVVYLFRTQYVSRALDLSPGIAINNAEVGALLLDGYLRVQIPPGATEIRLVNRRYLWPEGAPMRTLRFDARAGSTHFVEFSVESYKVEKGYSVERFRNEMTTYIGVDLRVVPEDVAMRFLPKLKASK